MSPAMAELLEALTVERYTPPPKRPEIGLRDWTEDEQAANRHLLLEALVEGT
jgi:hypothetical protein